MNWLDDFTWFSCSITCQTNVICNLITLLITGEGTLHI